MKKFIKAFANLFFWVPLFIGMLCAFLAQCKVGYPSEWSWWVFPIIMFGPTIVLLTLWLITYFLYPVIPNEDGADGYRYHHMKFDQEKGVSVFVFGEKYRRYQKWERATFPE